MQCNFDYLNLTFIEKISFPKYFQILHIHVLINNNYLFVCYEELNKLTKEQSSRAIFVKTKK